MSETATVLVEKVDEKSGQTNGRDWTKYAIKDANGEWYSRLNDSIPKDYEGKRVVIEYEMNGKYKNIVSVKPEQDNGALPSSQTASGEADWDIIGLRKTRCHLWGAFLSGDACQSLIALSLKDKPDRKPSEVAAYLSSVGRKLVLSAEVDIYHRSPAQAEEDIPF